MKTNVIAFQKGTVNFTSSAYFKDGLCKSSAYVKTQIFTTRIFLGRTSEIDEYDAFGQPNINFGQTPFIHG